MPYQPSGKKISSFTKGTAITDASQHSMVQDGINKTFTQEQILDDFARRYGASLRTYEFQAQLVADDIQLGEYAIVEENNYSFYKITNAATAAPNVGLSSGLTAERSAILGSREFSTYDQLREEDPNIYAVGDRAYLTGNGLVGIFSVESGSSTDDGGVVISGASWGSASKHFRRVIEDEKYYTSWFVSSANGSTDNSAQCQACLDAAGEGSTIIFNSTPGGSDYRVSATKGTNDKYGLNISTSNINVRFNDGVTLRRLNSDISTFSLSFPLILIGVPDSNESQISNVMLDSAHFIGEDVRHTSSGSALMDGRQAVWLKNIDGFTAINCVFDDVDSGAIWAQAPGEFDYENSTHYNTTKCYKIKIQRCEFNAVAHAVPGRNLMHCLSMDCDNVKILDNEFNWCDVGVTCTGSYDEYDDKESDTFTDSNLGVSVKRSGRGYIIRGNTFTNSSEHALYLEAMDIVVGGNDIIVTNSVVCDTSQLQCRGRNVSISGGTMLGVSRAADINTGTIDFSWVGTSIQAFDDGVGGIINVQSTNLTSYIDARSDFYGSYKPMRNVKVSVTLNMPEVAQTNGVACRIITDISDANFPNGQMLNVDFQGTTISNAQHCFYMLNPLGRQINLSGVIASGKPFVESTFSSTGATSTSFIAVDDSSDYLSVLQNVVMDSCRIRGFESVLHDFGGAGSAGAFYPPFGIRSNRMDYIENWDTAAFRQPSYESVFSLNNGQNFLDRSGWFSPFAIQNSLSDGTSNSEKKTMMILVGSTDVRIFYDDSGNFKAL